VPHPFVPPAQLLNSLGISQPEAIDLGAIARHCGAEIRYELLTGCEARIIGFENRAIITVNSNSSGPRQRFSVGHELGHWMHDRGRAALSCTETQLNADWFTDNPEKRANRYAADLLLPVEMFVPRAANQPVTFGTVDSLATTFETSITATAIRLVENGPLPSMVICSDTTRRKWFTRSPILSENLWPNDTPGRLTGAFHLQTTFSPPQGPTVVKASEWINHPRASRYVVTEDTRRITPDLILTLLWWEDEEQLLDLDEEEESDDESERDPFDLD
jgi:hypothetical protein